MILNVTALQLDEVYDVHFEQVQIQLHRLF